MKCKSYNMHKIITFVGWKNELQWLPLHIKLKKDLSNKVSYIMYNDIKVESTRN